MANLLCYTAPELLSDPDRQGSRRQSRFEQNCMVVEGNLTMEGGGVRMSAPLAFVYGPEFSPRHCQNDRRTRPAATLPGHLRMEKAIANPIGFAGEGTRNQRYKEDSTQ